MYIQFLPWSTLNWVCLIFVTFYLLVRLIHALLFGFQQNFHIRVNKSFSSTHSWDKSENGQEKRSLFVYLSFQLKSLWFLNQCVLNPNKVQICWQNPLNLLNQIVNNYFTNKSAKHAFELTMSWANIWFAKKDTFLLNLSENQPTVLQKEAKKTQKCWLIWSSKHLRHNEIIRCLSDEKFCLTKLNPISIVLCAILSPSLSAYTHWTCLWLKNALGKSRSCIFIAVDISM